MTAVTASYRTHLPSGDEVLIDLYDDGTADLRLRPRMVRTWDAPVPMQRADLGGAA